MKEPVNFINYDCIYFYRYVLRVRRPAEGDCHFLHFPHSSPLPGRGVPDRELLVFTTCSEDGVAGGVGAEAVHAS